MRIRSPETRQGYQLMFTEPAGGYQGWLYRSAAASCQGWKVLSTTVYRKSSTASRSSSRLSLSCFSWRLCPFA